MSQSSSGEEGRMRSESVIKWRRTDLRELDDIGMKRLYKSELPAELFEVNWEKALSYFVLDYALLLSSTWMFMPTLRLGQAFFGSFLGSITAIAAFSMFYGLVMSSIYAVGCDCLHGIFTNSHHVNELFGRFCFTPLLVPFTSFQQRNVLYHKRINRVNQEDAKGISFFLSGMTRMAKPIPYVRKAVDVLVAAIDHLLRNQMVPFGNVPSLRRWTREMADYMARVHLENGFIAGFLALIVLFYGVQGLFLYTCCYANFVWWIYVDSYMCRLKGLKETTLHNRRVTAIDKPHQFDAQLWKFGKGVLQVHDHDYGTIVNHLRHHYNDCAGVRHILFGEVPHYNLQRAKRCILRHKELGYGETSQHANIFFDFWRIYNALGDATQLHELRVEGILSKPKRRVVPGLYSSLETEALREERWREDVARRQQNPNSLSFAGGWVYPDSFGTTQRRGTGLEAVSFFNSEKVNKRNKAKFLTFPQLLKRLNGDDSD